jgi:predicted nucleic acid-binding Zn ribbon protein
VLIAPVTEMRVAVGFQPGAGVGGAMVIGTILDPTTKRDGGGPRRLVDLRLSSVRWHRSRGCRPKANFPCTPVRWSLVQDKAVLRLRRPLSTRREDLEVGMRAGRRGDPDVELS